MNSDATAEPLPIFVYGTLMLGQPNDHLWQDSIDCVDAAFVTESCLYDFGYYPLLIEKPGYQVKGQLIRLKKDRFAQIVKNLDSLEGYDPERPQESEFRRVQMQVFTISGDRSVAWTYVGNEARAQSLPLVECGDWEKHVAERAQHIAAWWKEINTVLEDTRPRGDSRR